VGSKGFLPIETELRDVPRELLIPNDEVTLYYLKDYFRAVVILEATDRKDMYDFFRWLYMQMDIKKNEKEPLINIITWYEKDRWTSCFFLRKIHRPCCFFAEGDDNILISPASVDMGGLLILPLEKDFEKMTKYDIESVLREVSINENDVDRLTFNFMRYLFDSGN
jgi:hypothetical protein